jgi:hypothetical protein
MRKQRLFRPAILGARSCGIRRSDLSLVHVCESSACFAQLYSALAPVGSVGVT